MANELTCIMYHSSNSSNNSSRSILKVKHQQLVYLDIMYKSNRLPSTNHNVNKKSKWSNSNTSYLRSWSLPFMYYIFLVSIIILFSSLYCFCVLLYVMDLSPYYIIYDYILIFLYFLKNLASISPHNFCPQPTTDAASAPIFFFFHQMGSVRRLGLWKNGWSGVITPLFVLLTVNHNVTASTAAARGHAASLQWHYHKLLITLIHFSCFST